MSYASFRDFETYLEGFGTNYFGTINENTGVLSIDTSSWQDAINQSYNRINSILDSIERIPIVPVGTQPRTGSYHPYLIEWNVCDTIFMKLKSRHSPEMNNALPLWMQEFGTRAQIILDEIVSGKISFSTDTVRTGINIPQKVSVVGFGTLFDNWDFGFYNASDYPKMFHIKITGTVDGNNIGQAKFKYSEDDGVSYCETETLTGTSWIDIKDGLQIRWQPAVISGTQVQLNLNDEWKIECTPTQVRTSGFKSTFRTFGRG